jgi:hypothetical protein
MVGPSRWRRRAAFVMTDKIFNAGRAPAKSTRVASASRIILRLARSFADLLLPDHHAQRCARLNRGRLSQACALLRRPVEIVIARIPALHRSLNMGFGKRMPVVANRRRRAARRFRDRRKCGGSF